MPRSINKTYISILGELRVVRIDPAGNQEVRAIGGVVPRALLAALVFNRKSLPRDRVFQQVWDLSPTNINRIHTRTNVLRDELGDRDLIPRGENLGLLKDLSRLQTDWDLFHQLMASDPPRQQEAIALVRDTPLDGIEDNDKQVAVFIKRLRLDILREVRKACVALELTTDFTWGNSIPDEWPRQLPSEWPSLIESLSLDGQEEASLVPLPASTRRQPSDGTWTSEALFEPCKEGRARIVDEKAEALAREPVTWWVPGSHRWFGEYFAFWHRTRTIPCETIGIEYISERYDSERYGVDPDNDGDNDKAIIIGASKLLDDVGKKRLMCARTTWNFAHEWAKKHTDDLLAGSSRPSVFGLTDRLAYPGIAGVHSLVQTSDGYLLFALRDSRADFHQSTWSASFEESVAARGREFTGPARGDQTVLDAVIGGLYEEWGIEASEIETSTFLAVGREYVRTRKGRLDLSSSVLTAVRLKITLKDVWTLLSDVSGIPDRDEHAAWAGVRFASRSQVLAFMAAARSRSENTDLLRELTESVNAEINFFPEGASEGIPDYGLMPTSAARLYLGSTWLARHDWMAD